MPDKAKVNPSTRDDAENWLSSSSQSVAEPAIVLPLDVLSESEDQTEVQPTADSGPGTEIFNSRFGRRLDLIEKSLKELDQESGPLSALIHLAALEQQMALVDLSVIDDDAIRSRAVNIKNEVEYSIGERLADYDAGERTGAESIMRSVPELYTQTKLLRQRINRTIALDSLPLQPKLDRLKEMATDVEASCVLLGLDHDEGTPVAKALRFTESVIDGHQRAMFKFRCLVLMAKADGLAESETGYLKALGESIGLVPDEVAEVIADTRQIDGKTFSGDRDDAMEVIRGLANCARVDGVFSKPEAKMIDRIGHALRLKSDDIAAALKTRTVDDVTFLDVERALAFLGSQEKLPAGTHDSESKVAHKVREQMAIPASERLLLAWKPGMLSSGSGAAALTDQNLYLSNDTKSEAADDAPQRRRIPALEFSSINVTDGEAVIAIKAQQTTTFDSAAGPFLELCLRCIAAARRNS